MSTLSALALVALVLALPSSAAGGLVSSSEALSLEREGQARSVVDAYLAREDVARELAGLGVDPELARLRAQALSPSELDALAGRIHEAPAGGDGVIVVLGITFIVLLILELVGVINIFNRF
jgi:hypothetical protein